jgi:hypothetical protein
MITLRQAAMHDLEVHWAVQLSDVIAYLADYRNRLSDERMDTWMEEHPVRSDEP